VFIPKNAGDAVMGIDDLNRQIGLPIIDRQAVLSCAPVVREPDPLSPEQGYP
jgi:hypothetical protein